MSASLPPAEALARLIEGNRRFLDESQASRARGWSRTLAEGQAPFAVILGCSDSRMPVEVLFDQGFGDLFVVRIAGNVVGPAIVGSVEFAVHQLGTRLVVVLGHTQCGAISAALQTVATGRDPGSDNLRAIIDRIVPHITELAQGRNPDDVRREAMRANVRASADHLRHASPVLEGPVLAGEVLVVGAEYELETGRVRFFDGVPGDPERS